jgi:hypothetical protein
MSTTTTQRIAHRAVGTALAVVFVAGLSLALPGEEAGAAPERGILVTEATSPAPAQGIWGKPPRTVAEPRKS